MMQNNKKRNSFRKKIKRKGRMELNNINFISISKGLLIFMKMMLKISMIFSKFQIKEV